MADDEYRENLPPGNAQSADDDVDILCYRKADIKIEEQFCTIQYAAEALILTSDGLRFEGMGGNAVWLLSSIIYDRCGEIKETLYRMPEAA